YLWAGLVWVLCCFTRSTAIPMALLAAGYLVYHTARPWRLGIMMSLMLVLFAIPAGLHSYKALRIFAPFQFNGLTRLTFLSGTQTYEVHTDKGRYGFSSPAFEYPPIHPYG